MYSDKILCSSLLIRRWGTYHEFLIDILDSNIWLFHFRWVHTCFTQGFKNLWLQIKLNDRMQLWQYFEGDVLNKSRTLVLCLSRKNKTFMTISWVRLFLQQNTQRMGLLKYDTPDSQLPRKTQKRRWRIAQIYQLLRCRPGQTASPSLPLLMRSQAAALAPKLTWGSTLDSTSTWIAGILLQNSPRRKN